MILKNSNLITKMSASDELLEDLVVYHQTSIFVTKNQHQLPSAGYQGILNYSSTWVTVMPLLPNCHLYTKINHFSTGQDDSEDSFVIRVGAYQLHRPLACRMRIFVTKTLRLISGFSVQVSV